MVPFVSCFNIKHTGVNINLELTEMFGELGLLDADGPKIYLCIDSAANMKLAVRIAEDVVDVRCSCHLIQLVVKDSLELSPKDVVTRCQDLAVKVNRSPKMKAELKAACEIVETPQNLEAS